MAQSDDGGKKTFTVKDNRRFDDAGNERSEGAPPKQPSSEKAPPKSSPTVSPSPTNDSSTINFSSFLMSFATQALMQLGLVPPPDGVPLKPDPQAAKQTIDIIAMLEDKTKGNLDPEEKRLIQEALYSLRLSFVQATKK